jgi:uncharacterized cupredoxin-like copper-binding protein
MPLARIDVGGIPVFRLPSRLPAVAAFTLLALAAAACGTGATQAPAGSPTAPSGPVVNVEASEFKFAPAALSVEAGAVTFSVRNAGTIEHEFEIFEGDASIDKLTGLGAGMTRDLSVSLEAGDYTFVCKLAGHEEQGMTGTLTVTE